MLVYLDNPVNGSSTTTISLSVSEAKNSTFTYQITPVFNLTEANFILNSNFSNFLDH
jgi:hypothetical protein